MRYAIQWLRSLIFIAQMYVVLISMVLIFTPIAVFWHGAAPFWMNRFCKWIRLSARFLIGLRTEVRGEVPKGAVLVASKHQSFMDSITLLSVLDTPRFIMKKELASIPILGWHARLAGFVPVDRGKRGKAIAQLMADVKAGQTAGQLIIYPQGTRVAPGAKLPYKMGSAALYSQLGQDCVPVATNIGVFWPRKSIYRKSGTAVFEFLPTIKPGMPNAEFIAELEAQIETASNRLMAEAGFVPKPGG